jgi:hypothetical protein
MLESRTGKKTRSIALRRGSAALATTEAFNTASTIVGIGEKQADSLRLLIGVGASGWPCSAITLRSPRSR